MAMWLLQLNLLNPNSNTPVVISHLLNLIPFDGIDAYLPRPDATAPPVATEALTGPDSILTAAQPSEYTPIMAATLTQLKSAIRRCPEAARELVPTDSGVQTPGLSQDPETGVISCKTLEGISVNAAVQLLMAAEAARLCESGGLLAPAVATVRWAFENTPRNIPLTLMQYWGDPWQGDIAPLELAYACARLARADEGVRHACKILDFPQVRSALLGRAAAADAPCSVWLGWTAAPAPWRLILRTAYNYFFHHRVQTPRAGKSLLAVLTAARRCVARQ